MQNYIVIAQFWKD